MGFSALIFPRINEERFSVLYSGQKFSRPNTPVNVIIGALILKEMNQLTDDELLESLLFDVRYQHALHTTSFSEQPFSNRTVSRFRARLLEYGRETGNDLLKEEMLVLADAFVEYTGMDVRKKRMDSVMIATNCRRMSHLDLIYTCVENVIKQAAKQDMHLIAGFERYLDEDERNNTIYRTTPDEAQVRLADVLDDGHELLKRLSETHSEMDAFKILERCLGERAKEVGGKYELRENAEISSSSLQTPFDPDATFRSKAGKGHCGYVGNIVETVERKGEQTTVFITDFDYQRNTCSDSEFCKDVLDRLELQQEPVWLVADGGYFSVKHVEAAAEKNIELIIGAMVGGTPDPLMAEFEVDAETNLITRCPAGHAPLTSRLNGKIERSRHYRITFEISVCEGCPNKDICHVSFQKSKAVVRINENTIKRAGYMKKLTAEEYVELIRFRAGVEGIPSVLRRKYKVDKIPDRGYLRSKLWYTMKIGAINATRLLVKASSLLIRAVSINNSAFDALFEQSTLVAFVRYSPVLTPLAASEDILIAFAFFCAVCYTTLCTGTY